MEDTKSYVHLFLLFHFLIFYNITLGFDESLKAQSLPRQNITYFLDRSKKEADDNFLPLRFHIYFEESKWDLKSLKIVFEKAASRVSQLLHVIPIKERLLLERHSCEKKWFSGKHAGRCASIGSKYKGEFCENKIDKFRIPESHLQELHVFNASQDDPVLSLPAGDGVMNADYIFYVKTEATHWCQQEHVRAYASCCRFDQFGRPIAGFIDICPDTLNPAQFDKKYMFNVIIHEMFHALGFTKEMFLQFCEHSHNCERKKNIISKDTNGIYRLMLPSVVQKMKDHFNCSYETFGAPLESDGNGMYGSHWHSYLMYGSIMTANMGEPQYTAIDPISLSVFADSGWYRVNYSAADPYFWGKDRGCKFVNQQFCSVSEGLCNQSLNDLSEPHCDFLHQTIGFCSKLNEGDACGIYKPNISNDCSSLDIHPDTGILNYQACFHLKKYNKTKAMCAPYRCNLKHQIEIFIDDLWFSCSYNSSVQIGDITILCPANSILCHYIEHRYVDLSTSTLSTASLLLSSLIAAIFISLVVVIYDNSKYITYV